MRVVVVPSRMEEALRRELHGRGVVDRSARIVKRDQDVLIPVGEDPAIDLAAYGARLADVADVEPRIRPRDPKAQLWDRLRAEGIPLEAASAGWERLGDVVILRLRRPLGPRHGERIARVYGEVLGARTVVEDVSGVHGPLRTPDVRVLWGDGTETVHVEDGIRYKLDVARVMFSSGNLAERTSVARRVEPGAVVADLFAGIGYFTLPIALRARPAAVYACEMNPDAFGFLLENLRINRVPNVEPRLGDCRKVAPRGVADVVIMGHFDAADYLDVAFEALRGPGTIVFHVLAPRERFPEDSLERLGEAARAQGAKIFRAAARIVKSYAPGIVHGAIDADVVRQPKGLSGKAPSGGR